MNVDDFVAELRRADVPYGMVTRMKVLRKCGTRVCYQVVTVRLPKERGYIIYKILTGDRIKKMTPGDVGLFITTYQLNCLFLIPMP